MKKSISIIMLIAVIILAVSCASVENNEDIKELTLYNTQGENYCVSFTETPQIGFVDVNNELPLSLPIYINKYAFGQEGPLFEIDNSIIDKMTKNLIQYLNLLYGESNKSYDIAKHPEVPYQVTYNSGKTEMRSGVSGISIITTEYNIVQDIIAGNMLDNKLIKASMQYLGIDEPQVTSEVQYNEKDEPYEYRHTITEMTDDIFKNILNNSFNYIRVTYNPDTDEVLVQICKRETPEKYGDYKIVPYNKAIEYLKYNYPNMDTSDVKAEIYYSATIQSGYYIPCLSFI